MLCGLVLILLRHRIEILSITPLQESLIFHGLFCAGIVLFIFTRERVEDELIAHLRLQSFQVAVLATLCFILAGIVVEIFSPGIYQTPIDVLIFQGIVYIFWFRVRLFRLGKKSAHEEFD
jgi:hypothetical protein